VLAIGVLYLGGLFVFQSYSLLTAHRGSATEIAIAEADLWQRQIVLARKEELYAESSVRPEHRSIELEEPRAALEISSLRLQWLNEPPPLSNAQSVGIILKCVAAGLCIPIVLGLLRVALRMMQRLDPHAASS
jgi:hypothetical protein